MTGTRRAAGRPIKWRGAFVTALFASAAAAPCLAQSTSGASAPAAAPDEAVGEIIVTATKRAENIQDVPISIQAITPLILDQRQVESFDDYAKLLPSVSFQSFGPGQSQLFFRGISSGGDGLHGGSQPAASTYVDETPLTTIGNGVDLHIYDVARVEALAGPQGTLFGANSLSGTLRVITNQPNPAAFAGGFNLEGNKFGKGGEGGLAEGFLNLPINDHVAIRLVGFEQHDGGYLDNVLQTRTFDLTPPDGTLTTNNAAFVKNNFNYVDTYGGRAALKVDLNDSWTVTPSIIYQNQKAHGSFLYDPKLGDLKVADFTPELNYDRWYQAALTIQGKVSDWDVVYSGGYFGRTVDNASDYSYYAVAYDAAGATSYVTFPDGHGGFLDPDQQFTGHDKYIKGSNELRISSPADKRIRMVAGLFTQRQSDAITANYFAPGILAAGTGITVPGAGDDIFYTRLDRVDRDSAVFTDVSFDITPTVTATAGIRGFKVNNTLYGFSGFQSNALDPSCATTTRTDIPCVDVNKQAKQTGETHKVNLTWKVDPEKMLYLTYSTGFRPGGANRRPGINPYLADTLSNYEAGWKTTWFGGRFRVNGAIFLEDWDKLQYGLSPVGSLGVTNIYNAGNARSKGVEGNLIWKPSEHWTVSAAGTYVDARLTTDFCQFDAAGNSVCTPGVAPAAKAGDRLPIQPKLKGSATVRYEFAVKTYQSFVQGSVNSQTSSRSYLTDNEANALGSTAGFTTADFSAGFGKDNWTFEAFIQNAFDERGELSINTVCAPTICGAYGRIYPTKPQFFGLKFGRTY